MNRSALDTPDSSENPAKKMWDEEFLKEEFVYGVEPNDFLVERHDAIPKGRVLLLAEGEGRNAIFLAQRGYDVTAVDISQVGLTKAKRRAEEVGVELATVCADLEDYDLGEGRWDGIVSISCHLPPALRRAVHGKVERALVPGGVFLLEAYTPKQLARGTGGPPSSDMMMTSAILKDELPLLSFPHLRELERSVIEGVNHTGHADVVQAIAVR